LSASAKNKRDNEQIETMKYISILFSVLSWTTYGQKIKFVEKDYVIKDSNPVQTLTLRIPNSCDEWGKNIRPNLNDFIAFSSRETSLQKFYDKLQLVALYGNRLKDLTTAQCHINQNSNVIDPNFSDQVFFSDIVKNYFEFQAISDLYLHNLDENKQDSLKNSVIEIYRAVYKYRKDDLISMMIDLVLNIKLNEPGVNLVLKRNNTPIKGTVTDANGYAKFVVEKQLTVPEPDELIEFTIEVSSVSFTSKTFKIGLGELTAKSFKKAELVIDLESEMNEKEKIIQENYEFKKNEINKLINKHKKYEN
jgi:uncharacterized tellurite resistance protein B-like protein